MTKRKKYNRQVVSLEVLRYIWEKGGGTKIDTAEIRVALNSSSPYSLAQTLVRRKLLVKNAGRGTGWTVKLPAGYTPESFRDRIVELDRQKRHDWRRKLDEKYKLRRK